MSTENIDLITSTVLEHRKAEDQKYMKNPAVARYATLYNGRAMNLWMVMQPNNAGVRVPRASLGRTHIHIDAATTLTPKGDKVFSRDSKMGGHLIMAKGWQSTYTQNNGVDILLDILSRCQYLPDRSQRGDAENVEISLPDDDQTYLIASLKRYFLDRQQESSQAEIQRAQLERELAEEASQTEALVSKMAAFDAELAERRARKDRNRRLIKEQASLRMKPVLDAQQERIKRSGLYDNTTVIIDGGPGTGKTTSLIQRIKYFTDPEVIEENLPSLNADIKREILDRSNPSWLFLSPSPLLKAYLKESMSQEGLRSNNNTVQVWKDHRSSLVKSYGLINAERSNAFKSYRHRQDLDKAFFLQDGKGIKAYTDRFERHLVQVIRQLFKPAEAFTREDFLYSSEVTAVQRILAASNPKSLMGLVTLLESLKAGPGQRLAADGTEFNEALRAVTLRVQVLSSQDEERKEKLFGLIRDTLISQEPDLEEDDEELGEEGQNDDEPDDDIYTEAAITKRLNGKIRGIVRKLASQSIGQRAKLTTRQEELTRLLVGIDEIDTAQLKYIGETLLFRKVFGRILRGTGSLLLTRLPAYYRSYRKSLHDQPIPGVVSISMLKAIVEKGGNTRLHPDEQSFLIGFINNFLKQLNDKKKSIYNNLTHGFKEAYEENSKRVIAVDEASDFTLADVYAIESLLRPQYASLTLCGDIMQRITSTELESGKMST